MKKRLMSLILLSCMILSFLPVMPVNAQQKTTPVLKWDFYMEEAEDIITGSGFVAVGEANSSGGKAAIGTVGSNDTAATRPGDLTLEVDLSLRCTYSLYVRASFPDAVNRNSFLYSVDGAEYVGYWGAVFGEYVWLRFQVGLSPGKHNIRICSRRADVLIDKVILTNHPAYDPGEFGADCDVTKDIFDLSDTEKTLYANIPAPAYLPKKEHPRVLVNKEDLPAIRENLTHEQNIKAYNTILNWAKLDPSVCEMPNFIESGLTTNYQTTHASAYFIEANAFLYLITGDATYGRKAIDGSKIFLKTLDNAEHYDRLGASRDSGTTIFSVALAYDWCYDLMSPQERREIIEYGMLQFMALEYGYPQIMSEHAFHSGHLTEHEFMKLLLAFAIATYDEYPAFYNIVGGKLLNDFVPTKNFLWKNDIHNLIGNGYGREAHELFMVLLLDKMGAGRIVTENWKNQFIGHLYTMIPAGNVFRIGDAVNTAIGSDNSLGIPAFYAANYYKDPQLKKYAYERSPNASYFISPSLHLIYNDVNLGMASYKGLPLSMYSGPLNGAVVARTGWEKDIQSNDMVVYMRTPQNFIRSHAHNDAGQFQIYYKGMLAQKSGIYNLFGSLHDSWYYKQSIAANCMLIYNPANDDFYKQSVKLMGGQFNNNIDLVKSASELEEQTKVGTVLGVDFGDNLQTPDFSYLKGDLTLAYRGNAENYTRTFTFFNFFDEVYPGALIVFDKVTANKDFKRTWLLHSANEPVVEGNKQTVARTDGSFNGRLVNETLLPKNAVITKVGGEGKEYMVGNTNYEDTVTPETCSWRLEISPAHNQDTDYFLNVLQVSENDDSIVPLETMQYDIGTHVGVKIKERVAFLSKSETRSARSITFTVQDDAEELLYMVDGLKAGTWKITHEGKEIGKKEATERGGVLNFKGAPGTYTVSYYSEAFTEKPLPVTEYRGLEVQDDGLSVSLNGSYCDILADSFKIEGDTIKIPFEEFMQRMSLTDFYQKTETGYKITFFENQLDLDLDKDCEVIDGKVYVDADKLKETLKLSISYSELSNTLSVESGLHLATAKDIKQGKDPSHIRVKSIIAQTNNPHQAMDKQPITNYAINNPQQNAYIIFEFEQEETLKDMTILWGWGNGRINTYRVEASVDGVNYETIFDGKTEGLADPEHVIFEPTRAKYVRVTGIKNSKNSWFTIGEVEFYK